MGLSENQRRFNCMWNKIKRAGLAVGALGASVSAFAEGTPVDYGSALTTNLTSINTIWGSVATIMIGVALVTVGVRFFRKAK